MKTNKEKVLAFIKEYSHKYQSDEYPQLTTQFLSENLNMQRTNISSLLNQLVHEGMIKKINGRPVLYQLNAVDETTGDFEQLIGYDQSLKEAVMLAKAAILYPQGNPRILLSANSGSGITSFAKAVYRFAIGSHVLKVNAPFHVIDCRAFMENGKVLENKLFGTQHEGGILHQCHQGMLLIKNSELMPLQIREMLFHSFENQHFSNNHLSLVDDYSCIVICSLSVDTKSTIYNHFQSYLNFTLNLPPLDKRTRQERYQFIELFLKQEAALLEKTISLHSSVLNALMLYQSHDIKGLQNDIHNACVSSYAKSYQHKKSIEIVLSDFNNEVRKGVIYYKSHKDDIDLLISQNCQYTFTKSQVLKNNNGNHSDIYKTIDQKKKDLKKQDLSLNEMNTIISLDLYNDFEDYFQRIIQNIDSMETLQKIVSMKLIQMVDKFLKDASLTLHKIFEEKILFGLSIHLNALIIAMNTKQRISAEQKSQLIDLFPDYYQQARLLIEQMEKEFHIQINSDEVVFVMLFMLSGYDFHQQKKIATMIVMHGYNVASALVDVVKALTQKDNVYGYDLALDKSITVAYEELKQVMIEANQGKGLILIYDMGSIRTMVDSIVIETGIEVRYIEMPLTLMAMMSVNKTQENVALEDAHLYLNNHFKDIQYVRKQQNQEALLIISPIKSDIEKTMGYLNQNFDLNNYQIFTLHKSELGEIYNEIDNIQQKYKIVGIISSYNLHLSQFSFLNIKDVSDKKAHSILDLFAENDELGEVFTYMQEQFVMMNIDLLKMPLTHFLQQLPQVLNITLDMNQKVGLLIHMICLIDKLQKHAGPSVNFVASNIIVKEHQKVKQVQGMLKEIETIAGIVFNESEIATIISIANKQ